MKGKITVYNKNIRFFWTAAILYFVLSFVGFWAGGFSMLEFLFQKIGYPEDLTQLAYGGLAIIASFAGFGVGLFIASAIIRRIGRKWQDQLDFGNHAVLKISCLALLFYLIGGYFLLWVWAMLSPEPAHSYFNEQSILDGNTISAAVVEEFDLRGVSGACDCVSFGLESGSGSVLYSCLSEVVQDTFSEEDFSLALLSREVIEVEIDDNIRTLGSGWVVVEFRILFSDGVWETHEVIFKYESGQWRLFGSQKV